MRQKTSIFGSGSTRDTTLTDDDYVNGFRAGTVAYAEAVNEYGYRSDDQLAVVSDEICNAITQQGVALDNNNNAQLSTVLRTKIGGGTLLTGIVYDSFVGKTMPALSNGTITFPAFKVQFNNKVLYGTAQADFTTVDIAAQSVTASTARADGVWFLYASVNGTIEWQSQNVLVEDGATKCLLGSVFVISGRIQDGSWAFTPWLQQSSVSTRSAPTARIKGGLVMPASATTMKIGALQIDEEGINFGSSQFNPNIKNVSAASPMSYKFLYKGYNPSNAAKTTLEVDHIFNMTSGTWDTIPAGTEGFVVMVPCVTPTGQTLLIPPMSEKPGATYTNIFSTQKEAENAVFGLQYQLSTGSTDVNNPTSVAERAIYLGQSIIVKIGYTDLTDPEQFEVYGVVPQSLAGFTDQGGQTGGGTGGFVPMNEEMLSGNSVILLNNTSNIVTASASNVVTVSFPSPESGKLNQLEVKFTPNSSQLPGIQFPAEVKWWEGVAPTIEANTTYAFIFEYNRSVNTWVGGFLKTSL